MVRASFRALQRQGVSHKAHVLDPAAGAGVFLLTAFRELAAEYWRVNGKRADTNALRSILYGQIVGFDINEAALRFAALGLYLLSIELDPNPRPVNKLRFRDLRGKVLHRVSAENKVQGSQLGSLGPLVSREHIGRYDLVIGNPPWASATKLPDWDLVTATISQIAANRKIVAAPPLPNEVLDLPFVWRAMEWAKPGGQITFALHARLLFQQGDGMAEARQALFDALDVTSIINGSELRQTKVWPEISAPFCLLFAANSPPDSSAGFRLISPRIETSLNDTGIMRIDAANADIVPARQLRETPDILKILFRGTKAVNRR
jgi:type I restriction-modification system DNA methylase subunit